MIESSAMMQSFPAVQTGDDGAGKLLLQARGRVVAGTSPRLRYECRISMKNISFVSFRTQSLCSKSEYTFCASVQLIVTFRSHLFDVLFLVVVDDFFPECTLVSPGRRGHSCSLL